MKLLKKLIIFCFIFAFAMVISSEIFAKVLPRSRGVSRSGGRTGYFVSARLRPDRLALNVTFNNVGPVADISYSLSYQTAGNQEGAGGSIQPTGAGSLTRELLFGTCSAGVCRYHTGITNAKLEVTTTFKSGKQAVKRFKIRV